MSPEFSDNMAENRSVYKNEFQYAMIRLSMRLKSLSSMA